MVSILSTAGRGRPVQCGARTGDVGIRGAGWCTGRRDERRGGDADAGAFASRIVRSDHVGIAGVRCEARVGPGSRGGAKVADQRVVRGVGRAINVIAGGAGGVGPVHGDAARGGAGRDDVAWRKRRGKGCDVGRGNKRGDGESRAQAFTRRTVGADLVEVGGPAGQVAVGECGGIHGKRGEEREIGAVGGAIDVVPGFVRCRIGPREGDAAGRHAAEGDVVRRRGCGGKSGRGRGIGNQIAGRIPGADFVVILCLGGKSVVGEIERAGGDVADEGERFAVGGAVDAEAADGGGRIGPMEVDGIAGNAGDAEIRGRGEGAGGGGVKGAGESFAAGAEGGDFVEIGFAGGEVLIDVGLGTGFEVGDEGEMDAVGGAVYVEAGGVGGVSFPLQLDCGVGARAGHQLRGGDGGGGGLFDAEGFDALGGGAFLRDGAVSRYRKKAIAEEGGEVQARFEIFQRQSCRTYCHRRYPWLTPREKLRKLQIRAGAWQKFARDLRGR